MEKKLSQVIGDYDQIIVGIGNEWNWIKPGLNENVRYHELVHYCEDESNKWLLPIVEFEYGFYNNNSKIDDAYKALRKLIGDKPYFLISETFIQDALLNGFDEKNCVYPCGNFRYLQTNDPSDELIDVRGCEDFNGIVNRIRKIVTERNGRLLDGEGFYKPFQDGKSLFLNQKRPEYSNIKYNESAYLENWGKYTQFLSNTMGKSLLLIELGVSLDYPTVIRWPFEKVAFVNNKAHLIRVHDKLYHHTPEIKDKTDSIQMNSVNYILQESEGL